MTICHIIMNIPNTHMHVNTHYSLLHTHHANMLSHNYMHTLTHSHTHTAFALHALSIPETTSSTSEKIYLKEKVYVRDPHPTISIFPPSLSLGFIKSDNINWHGNFTNGNNTYPANQDIIWQINVPRGCRMTMAFSLFDLEPSDGCDKDYFSIQTSKNHTKSASPKYCDQLMSVEIRWRKRAQFWLHSDEENEGKGIRAAFCFSPSDREGMACSCNLQSGGKRAVRSEWSD